MSSDQDDRNLARLGYKQQLKRTNGYLASLATSYQCTNPFVGVFTLYGQSLSLGGPSFIWGLAVVCAGQFVVTLVLMELASSYPLAGSVYQWCRLTLGPRAGCFVAYMYLVATLASLGPYALVTVSYMSHGLGLGSPEDWEQCVGAVGVVCLWTAATVLGVRPVAVLGQLGAVLQLMLVLVLSIAFLTTPEDGHQSASVLVDNPASVDGWMGALACIGWTFWGFEGAASMSEETHQASSTVPQAIGFALLSCFCCSLLLDLALTLSIPDLQASMASNGTDAIQQVLQAHTSGVVQHLFNIAIALVYLAGGLVIYSMVTRVLWSLARDGDVLPASWSLCLRQVSQATQVPVRAGLAITMLLVVMLLLHLIPGINLVTVAANFSTCGMYTVYQSCAFGLLYHTLYAKPLAQEEVCQQGFTLGAFKAPVAIGSMCWGVPMMFNLVWPRNWAGEYSILVAYLLITGLGVLAAWLVTKDSDDKAFSQLVKQDAGGYQTVECSPIDSNTK